MDNKNSMRVIFLDIDGVVATGLSGRLEALFRRDMRHWRFDPVSLRLLRRAVKKSGAVVVLSSSWRDCLLIDDPDMREAYENLRGRLARNGTPLYDVTPMHTEGDKGTEIAEWLAGHGGAAQYAVLDDNNCFRLSPETAAHWIPCRDGLRPKQYRKLLRMLEASG